MMTGVFLDHHLLDKLFDICYNKIVSPSL